MEKSILVFSNGEKLGDGIIKLPLLTEIKKRFPNTKIYWMTDIGSTVYNNRLKNIASQYIEKIFEKAEISPFFWKKISKKYEFESMEFNYILDTQKAVLRTIALRRIKSDVFISASAGGLFSSKKIPSKNKNRKYYLEDLISLVNSIKPGKYIQDFKFPLPDKLLDQLDNLFEKNIRYIGYAPGAGEKNRIWNLEKFIEVAKYFENQNCKSVFFLGPEEKWLKSEIKKSFPTALYPEEIIEKFSGPEIVMSSTKYLSCALANDSGVGHMLSTKFCPLVKLFGHHDAKKFTQLSSNIFSISSQDYGSKNINDIEIKEVIKLIQNILTRSI